MKVALLGDTHCNGVHTFYMIQRAKAEGADHIFELGDCAYTMPFYAKFIGLVSDWCEEVDLDFWFIMGNHDDWDIYDTLPFKNGLQERAPRVYCVEQGHRWNWDGVDFMGLGGAYSIDALYRKPGVEWWPQELISPEEAKYASRPGNVDIMLTHDVPWGVRYPYGPETGGGNKDRWPESRANRYVLRTVVDAVEPNLLFHGHCHYFYDDKIALDSGHEVRVTGLARDTMDDSYILLEF